MIIRASSADLVWACAAAATPELAVDPVHEASETGTAVHRNLAMLVRLGTLPDEMPDGEIAMLSHMGAKMWREHLRDAFPGARCEVEHRASLDDWALTGHPDVESVAQTTARILDWKTGRKDAAYEHQMRAYAVLLMSDHEQVEEVVSTVAWLRTQEIETYRTTRQDAIGWVVEMAERLRHTDVFRPGAHCTYCHRAHECPGRSALVRRSIADVLGQESPSEALARMPPAEIVELYRKAKLASKAAAEVEKAIKAHVEVAGDVVADGERLTIETTPSREVDAYAAWTVLQDAIADDEALLACVRPSLSKINSAVAKAAGKGKGSAAVRALEERLREAGAIKDTEKRSLTSRRDAA